MGDEGGSESDDVSFLRTEDMVCLSCTSTGERVCLAAEGFGNRHCFLENIADKNNPPDLSQCVFVIEQALSVRALQELVTAAGTESGKGTGSGHRTLLYGNAILLRHENSNMYLACLSTTSGNDKLAFDVGLQEHSQGEACWWTLHPASKQRSEGEKVRVGDDLILVSVATERYLQSVREGDTAIVNASFHVTHWSVQPFGTGLSRVKYVGYVFGGEVLRFFHGGDECLTVPATWGEQPDQNMVVYEGGEVVNQARSLWRLELARTKWAGGFINWMHPLRIKHITTGRYLGVNDNNELILVHRQDATLASTCFYVREEKDDQKAQLEDKDLEVIGSPVIKYGDSTVIMQHMETSLWLSYKAYETKKKGVGKVEEKQAILHEEGKMDDGVEFSRSQVEESRTARVIRKCSSLFTKFIKALEVLQVNRRRSLFMKSVDLGEMVMCLEDLINYFAQPEEEMEHEERQNRLKALRNRQDLFQEEGILNLILDAIDNINTITSQGFLVSLAGEDAGPNNFDVITAYLYQLLAAIIKGNHTNCAQFANINRLNWLFSRLGSQASGEGSGMLDVLHCVLIDSPEALNMMREEHIKVIISLLEKHGRDPKVLDVLCSLCVGNGVAVRSSQNNISDYLLPGKNLLLQTQLVDHVGSVRPNIFVGRVEGSAMYHKWYFEVTLDHVEQATHMVPHLRIGWANTAGYIPYPGGGEKWGGNGVGDDLYSFGFDGAYLWTGGRSTCVVPGSSEPFIRKGDVIGCALDLSIPMMTFYFNGVKIRGAFKNFNLEGMFFPVVSMSSKCSCRFLLGGDQGRLKFPPPENHSPLVECVLPTQTLSIDPCFYFGDLTKTVLAGPLIIEDDSAFVPTPVDTEMIQLASFVETVRDKLAENIHEMWAMNKIEAGWIYGDYRDDYDKIHPCLVPFDRLPDAERHYDIQLAGNTLRTVVALGYHISLDKPPARIRSIRLPNDPFLQPNGYKPAPLDLSAITLTPKLEELVDSLAENTHNIWAKERISEGWTYGLNEDPELLRSPHLVPYSKVDEAIKIANWDTASETVRTLLVYGYILEPPTGEAHELQKGLMGSRNQPDYRTYRAEKTYAVADGKWYYELEVLTSGPMRVGWVKVDCKPGCQIGNDECSWAFDGFNEEKCTGGVLEAFGRQYREGDVVGVFLDLIDRTISFSLNGELLMDSMGGEVAFTDVQGEGFVPACTLGVGQRAKLVFGHDVNALKYFTLCGLQEGYEPFCVNMNRAMTFWYTKDQPIFDNMDDFDDSPIEVTRIPAGGDAPPSLRLSHKTFETMEKANWEFLRLSLPVICLDEFIDENEKARRWQEIRIRQHRLKTTVQITRTNQFEQSMTKAGFSMSDIKELQRGYSEDGVEVDSLEPPMRRARKPGKSPSRDGPGESGPMSMSDRSDRSGKDHLSPEPDGKNKKERGKSPFSLTSMYSFEEITGVGKEYASRFFTRSKRDESQGQPKISRTPEEDSNTLGVNRGAAVKLSQSSLKVVAPDVPERKGGGPPPPSIPQQMQMQDSQVPEEELFDTDCLNLMNEYFYGLRIFPGQDPSHVFVGWVTTQYHFHSSTFSNENVRAVSISAIDEFDADIFSVDRSSCYMLRADEIFNQVSQDSSGKSASQGMFVGCSVDTSTGYMTFSCDGKPTNFVFKMEPGTKLFPAVFVEATSKDMLQFELGRTPTTLPLSSAVLLNSGKHIQPQFPPRLKVQFLRPHQWARVPNNSLKIHALKLSELRGWSTLCEDPISMLALHIPEEDRCIDILELIELEKLLSFHFHTLTLYAALCYQSNYRAAHSLCFYVDQKQLLYAIQEEYMSGPLRRGFYDLLIALHLESFAATMEGCKKEFIVPLTPELKEIYEDETMRHSIRSVTTISVRPEMKMSEIEEHVVDIKELSSPAFCLEVVRDFAMKALEDAVRLNQVHNRDPIGGSNENLFVPLLKLLDKLLLVGVIQDEDLSRLLVMIDPITWDPENSHAIVFNFVRFPSEHPEEDVEDHRKGLLFMELAEGVKLQMCYLVHHMNDIQLRHRVESIVAFSTDYVGDVQADQLKRYAEIKQSDLPSAVAAKKTREFRCPPVEQMKAILGFKNLEMEDEDNRPCGDHLITQLTEMHAGLMETISLEGLQKDEGGEEEAADGGKLGLITKVIDMLNIVKKLEPPEPPKEEDPPREKLPEEIFRKVLTTTIVRWAEETHFESPLLVREMFGLLLRQYNVVGEMIGSLEKTYVFNSHTIPQIKAMWGGLSRIRALLPVQMSQEEEGLMRFLLWELVNNHIFFQHPDLIRILGVHENVMALMINTLGRQAAQSEAQGGGTAGESGGGETPGAAAKEKDTSHEMVVGCCRFLCYFCRTSRQNQKAMFEHLGFLLENSNILLSRPSLRGSTPLDVAYSSLMDNTELALALREHLLEKIAVYLSRCGLQSNSELLEKGYPDLGWDPVEGERYLDFLRFCVWVGGESVEENANLVIRLLIRRPECLGPALRGEGEGLLRAIIDANRMSDRINARNNGEHVGELDHPMPESEDDEDYIDTGAAILSFYCTLVDLLGRCAPDAAVIAHGKNDSLRARAILRSLVPLEDLQGALSLRFSFQSLGVPGEPPKRDVPPGLVPNHKQSIVSFLERVYGIEERDLFFKLLEDAFLPDLRAATILDHRIDGGDSEMGLALNRYIGNSILPLLISHSRFYAEADNYASLLDATLHTVYRLSKNKMLTKGQREAVSDFLVALTREMQPNMLLKLLRKLTVDVSKLTEYTTVALRLLTLHYERCGKYYSTQGGPAGAGASEEEKRLTMMLFSNIFESLSKMEYDPDLFGKALPCLSAIGCALPPDYSLSNALDGDLLKSVVPEGAEGPYQPCPIEAQNIQITADLNNIIIKFSEHYHDAWAKRKLDNGWKLGDSYSWTDRIHPRVKPYTKLSEYEKERYKEPIRDSVKALLAMSWVIEQGDVDMAAARSSATRRQSKEVGGGDANSYVPRPVDMANLTLSREMQNLAERLAENAHDIWARKKKEDIENTGGCLHPQLVPFDLLTDKEKKKNRERNTELLKYAQFQGYKLQKLKAAGGGEDETGGTGGVSSLERRFAYNFLEKLLHYLDVSSINMKSFVPSSNFSRRSSFKETTRDVKFFSKVVLPLMEKYFNTHRHYFLVVATPGSTGGAASLKEKEMVATLFCRLASLLRCKYNAFGSDVKITVRCLQVVVKAFDAKSITKSCPEFIRTSMLTYFNNVSDDLGRVITNLQEKKYAYLRGSHLKTCTSLNYVNTVVLPVLTSMFDHLASYDYGSDLLLDDIQVACYKMLNSLYILGTDSTLPKSRKYMKIEIERYRPAIGNCLGAYASTFPVAFLEPGLNKNNPHSLINKMQDQSLQAQDVMARLGGSIPTLDKMIAEVEAFVDSEKTYNDIPHILDISLPMLCAYLPFWWAQGPDNNTNAAPEAHVSNVTVEHMNKLLRSVLKLIMTNIGNENALWMTRIAAFTQQIIINSSDELLKDPILPLAEKLRKKTENMFHKEESVRGFLKSGTDDTSQLEGQIQEEWQLLVRDIYAFYPLLIKYVDYQRNNWLKNNTPEAEYLYNHVAEIFNLWSKSQYFRREETNFISANEIDNMALIMPSSSRRTAVADVSNAQAGGKIKKKKRQRDKKKDKDKELASSLMVACLKRLLPVGLNLFAGREQELVQHCKDRFLKKMGETDILEFAKTQLTLPDKIDPSDAMSWQHHLYSKLGTKKVPSSEEDELGGGGGSKGGGSSSSGQVKDKQQQLDELVDRIVAMAKVLFGLHMIDHPQQSAKDVYHSVVTVGRKKAVIACFRQIAVHHLPRHRAINLFLRTYREMWLADENVGQEIMIEHLTNTFEEAELKKSEEGEGEEGKPDPLTQLVTTFTRGAMEERSGALEDDELYMSYAEVMALSNGKEEEEEEEGEGGEGEEGGASIHEQEMEKQKLLFHQARLASRGVAEMVLLHISACKGVQSDMVMKTLDLGISILRGGNVDIQMQMLNHLKEKKEVGFFTSIAGLMNSCSVLDLDAFERNTKAEGLGVGSEGAAGEKNMHDAEFTCVLFRFIQLTCEGHNLDWQNYLRTQAGNTTTVNVVICTVDYLLRLQESIMDFYWHYSSKEIIDPAGKVNFFKAIGVASQVFNTLTEVIQGPCTQNQQALAHSRLWDAIGGFLFLFANMQAKLSKNASQVDLLKELLNLQKDMVIMMLSMLEGNVVNGTIGKQMVDTLVESASNVEIILCYFDMFLKLKDLTSSASFQEMDINKDGWITPKEFREKMEQGKNYTPEEINFLLMCCDTNHDGKIDYIEFTERFHNPAKEIGFNLAVLLTNLSEHMPNEPRLARFLETAGSVLNYFELFLGRIEIMGSSHRIERVYFEILESNIEQWEKPQIRESKRAFFYSVVTEGGDKEKLEAFVDFCEDAIFEMQHASALMATEEEGPGGKAREPAFVLPADEDEEKHQLTWTERGTLVRQAFNGLKNGVRSCLSTLSPNNVKRKAREIQSMTPVEMVLGFFKLLFYIFYSTGGSFGAVFKYLGKALITLMRGPPPEKVEEKPAEDFPMSSAPALPPPEEGSSSAGGGGGGGMLAILGDDQEQKEGRDGGGELVPAEGADEEGNKALVAAARGMSAPPEERKAAAPEESVKVGHASPLDVVVETHAEPSVASQGVVNVNDSPTNVSNRSNPSHANSSDVELLLLRGASSEESLECFSINPYFIDSDSDQPRPDDEASGDTPPDAPESPETVVACPPNEDKSDQATIPVPPPLPPPPPVVEAGLGDLDECPNKPLPDLPYRTPMYYKKKGRSNTNSSIFNLIDFSGYLSGIVSFLARNFYTMKMIALVMAFVINVILLFYKATALEEDGDDDDEDGSGLEGSADFESIVSSSGSGANGTEDDEGDEEEEEEDTPEYLHLEEKYYYLPHLLRTISVIHSLISLAMLFAYYHLKVPLVIFKREKEIARRLEFDGLYIAEQPEDRDIRSQWDKLVISAKSFPVNYWDKFVKKKVRQKYSETYDFDSISTLLGMEKTSFAEEKVEGGFIAYLQGVDWRYQLWKAGVTVTDNSFLYSLWYFCFSVLGNFNFFFFAAHLLDVAVAVPALKTILQSVTHNGKQLMLTVMLLSIVVYIYTVVAFNFFRKFYVTEEDDEVDQKCHDMATCFVFHLYQGVRAGGGIGDVIEPPDGTSSEVYRIFFDITFFFFVIVILLAIIQGLIIDAFGELRDQLNSVSETLESECFICGIGKDFFEVVPHGFDNHVMKEHNLANYMFFLMHLINKPDTEYTGQETYVWNQYQQRSWDFFPVGDCFRKQYEAELSGKSGE